MEKSKTESEVVIPISSEAPRIESLGKTQKKSYEASHGRTIEYYSQNVEGKSPSLGIHLKGNRPVIGVVFKDGTIAWSKEPGRHDDIIASQEKALVARFQGIPDSRGGPQNIQIALTQHENAEEIAKSIHSFMRRSHVVPISNLRVELNDKNPRLLYSGVFSRFFISTKAQIPQVAREVQKAYTPKDRAIVYDQKTGRIASAWAHNTACGKLGLEFGDPRIIRMLRNVDGSIIIPLNNTHELRQIARTIKNAGEPGKTIVELRGGKKIPLEKLLSSPIEARTDSK